MTFCIKVFFDNVTTMSIDKCDEKYVEKIRNVFNKRSVFCSNSKNNIALIDFSKVTLIRIEKEKDESVS